MTREESIKKYKEYLEGHIGNVIEALEQLYKLDIPYITNNIDELRLIVKEHDKSKYDEPEWSAYLHHFYPINDEESMMDEEFDVAVKHHIKNNKHHWDFWCDENNNLIDFDDEEYHKYNIERICDYMSMSYQYGQNYTDWWNTNKEFMIIPDVYKDEIQEILELANKNNIKLVYIGSRNNLEESFLYEARAGQLKNKTKMEDPARVEKSKNVKSTYIGMSKFGILNFKTTSESRNGYHYQTVEFQDMKPFQDLIKKNGKIMPDDIKKELNDSDINLFCSCESFSYWSWYYQAYQNDYAYIDDNIPNLSKRMQAPTINNVRLKGALCKHLYSVLEYLTRPYVLLAISDDITKYLEGNKEDKYSKQDVKTANWYDSVSSWTEEDTLNYLGMDKEQIYADLSKYIKINPDAELEDYTDELVKEIFRKNKTSPNPTLVKEVEDKIVDTLDLDNEFNKVKPEEVEVNEEDTK